MHLTSEEQDWWLADWLVERYEDGEGRAAAGYLLSALRKVNPFVKYYTAWKVLDVWSQKRPPIQAAALPPSAVFALAGLAVSFGHWDLGLVFLLCYCGLLRVSEALNLRRCHLVFGIHQVTVILGITKRGMEQKVVIVNRFLVMLLIAHCHSNKIGENDRVFVISYSSVLNWLHLFCKILGLGDINVTTHSFRRSGASELSRRNAQWSYILQFGRWLCDRAAREYIRRGEVSILRVRAAASPLVLRRINFWALMLMAHKSVPPRNQVRRWQFANLSFKVSAIERAWH